jgi:hypothetical protein
MFMREQLGKPVPSPVVLGQLSEKFRDYYFYIDDENFGPLFIKVCSYAPWSIKLCLNGHQWAKRQLNKRGIQYESLDNGLVYAPHRKSCRRSATSWVRKTLSGFSVNGSVISLHRTAGKSPACSLASQPAYSGLRWRCSPAMMRFCRFLFARHWIAWTPNWTG